MKNIVFIIPYFGKLPDYYSIWCRTARYNNAFDFLFITDIAEIEEQENIHVFRISFTELRKRIQSKFGKKYVLDEPYKLCDYKPAYGYIFEDLIKDYKFWGYCDIDIILGDLSKFITDEILDNYDKIYEHGHMTLYRNNLKNRELFKNNGNYPEFNYEEVYSSPESFYFDEFYGMMIKCRRLGVKMYLNPIEFFDIDTQRRGFFDVHGAKQHEYYFKWCDGKLYAIEIESGVEREIVYVHLQKRKIDYSSIHKYTSCLNSFYIIPDKGILEINRCSKSRDGVLFKIVCKYRHIREFYKRYNKVSDRYISLFAYYKSRKEMKKRRHVINHILELEVKKGTWQENVH